MVPAPGKRIVYLDYARVVACFLVILTHSPVPTALFAEINFVAVSCIPLFFLISGALTLPLRREPAAFLRSRLPRLVIPTVVWSLLQLLLRVGKGEMSAGAAGGALFVMPFRGIEGMSYWYLYTAIGLTLVTPYVSVCIQHLSRRMVELFLLLWGVTLLLPYWNALFPGVFEIQGSFYFALYPFGGFLGYVVLGYYLHHHEITWRTCIATPRGRLVALCALSVVAINPALFVLRCCGVAVTFPRASAYLNGQTAVIAVVILLLLKALAHYRAGARFVGWLAPYTFGIYLAHLPVMREVVSPVVAKLGLAKTLSGGLGTAVATMVLALAVIWLLSKIPRLDRRIIGM